MSVEEMLKEIFGVLDKLSREWRLWTWTQQYNFLDSSTKNINFSDAVSFTVSVSREDVFNKPSKESKQFSDKVAEKENAAWQYDFGIANPVHDVAVKNKYRVIWYAWESVNDYSAAANPDVNREANEATSVAASSTVDQWSVSRTDRYLQIAQDLDTRLDRQWDFWKEVTDFTEEWRKYAEALYAKK